MKKRLNNNNDIAKASKIVESMGSLSMRPLLLAHIDGFLESSINDWREYNVYYTLIRTWLMREARKLNVSANAASDHELFLACIVLACVMQTKGAREISGQALEKFVDEYRSLTKIPYISFGGRSLLNKNSDGEYRFSHYTIQEFLVAEAILNRTGILNLHSFKITDKIFDFLEQEYTEKAVVKTLILRKETIGFRNLSNWDLSGMDLRETNFTGTNLKGANLSNANLENAVFRSAKLDKANLDSAKIVSCDFTNASLQSCSLVNSVIESALLRGANCSNADFSSSTIRDTDVCAANISQAKIKFDGDKAITSQ